MNATLTDDITAWVEARVGKGRFLHILGVTELVVDLARRHGVDAEKAALAGLLHDCAKGLPVEEQRALAARGDWPVDEESPATAGLVHGPAGAVLAREEWNITDAELLDAIANHTIGCAHPSPLLRVLMAADYCEPTRIYPGADELRVAVGQDLTQGLIMILRHKEQHLSSRGREIHSGLYEMLRFLESQQSD